MASTNNSRSTLTTTTDSEGLRRSARIRALRDSLGNNDHAGDTSPPRSLLSVANSNTPRLHTGLSSNISRSPQFIPPALLILPPNSTEEDIERALAACSHAVAVTGSAALGRMGPPIGSIDIFESKDTYLFRVALPGIAQDSETFSWYIVPNGKVFIKGVATTGEKMSHMHGMEFELYTNNLCPPGDFSISFKLPGPVDPEGIQLGSGKDGMFEGIVKKAQP